MKIAKTPFKAAGPYVYSGNDVIAIFDTDNAGTERYEAHAHLFAAAPDMLAALRRLRGFAANYAHQSAIDAASGLFDAVDAAISKAEGRT